MRKIFLRILYSRIGVWLAHRVIGLAAYASEMPASLRQYLLRCAQIKKTRLSAVGVAVWVLRFRFRVGTQKTSINPGDYCKTLDDADFFIRTVTSVPLKKLNETAFVALQLIKQSLEDSNMLGAHGTLQERSRLVEKIETFTLNYLKAFPERKSMVSQRARYALEERDARNPSVRQLVKENLEKAVADRFQVLDEKLTKRQQPHDIVTVVNLQAAVKNFGMDLFLCGDSLLALMREGIFCLNKRLISFGVMANTEEFEHLSRWMSEAFDHELTQYEMLETSAPDNLILLKKKHGARVEIWRHEQRNGYVSRRNLVHIWYNRCFEIDTYIKNNSRLNVPADWNLYLTEAYGKLWRVPKLFNVSRANNGNIAYTKHKRGVEYLIDRFTTSLAKGHRLPVTRALEDLADYFDIDYMAYLPVKDFYVDTPAERQRRRHEIEVVDTAYLLCSGGNMPVSASQIRALEAIACKHERLVAVTVSSEDIDQERGRLVLKSLRAFDDMVEVAALDAKVFQNESVAVEIYNFNLNEEQLGMLPDDLPPLNDLSSAMQEVVA